MRSMAMPLLLLGIVWIIGGTKNAAASTEIPDDQSSPANKSVQISDEGSDSAEAAGPPPVPTLQAHLNSVCEEKVKERCEKVDDDICKTKPVARKGVGTLPEQSELAWRCYGNLSAAKGKNDALCIDSCGVLFKCGTIPTESHHVTVPELETAITDTVDKLCSPYQKALNEICSHTRQGWVARKGVLAEGKESAQWRCFNPSVLDFELSSQCVDNCGTLIPCRGGRSEDAKSLLKEVSDYFNVEYADEQLKAIERPCAQEQVCMRTLQNPPKCVLPHEAEAAREEAEAEEERYAASAQEAEEASKQTAESLRSQAADKTSAGEDKSSATPPEDHRLSPPLVHAEEELITREHASHTRTLSGLLGSYCLKEFDYLCEEQHIDDFCVKNNVVILARKDVGKQKDAPRPVWRCVEKQKLDDSRSSVCVDGCGKPYICSGGIDIETTVHARWPELDILVEEKAADECAKLTGGLPNDNAVNDSGMGMLKELEDAQ